MGLGGRAVAVTRVSALGGRRRCPKCKRALSLSLPRCGVVVVVQRNALVSWLVIDHGVRKNRRKGGIRVICSHARIVVAVVGAEYGDGWRCGGGLHWCWR